MQKCPKKWKKCKTDPKRAKYTKKKGKKTNKKCIQTIAYLSEFRPSFCVARLCELVILALQNVDNCYELMKNFGKYRYFSLAEERSFVLIFRCWYKCNVVICIFSPHVPKPMNKKNCRARIFNWTNHVHFMFTSKLEILND